MLEVAQFIVINLVIIFVAAVCCFATAADARKPMPLLIDDDQHVRLNKPGKLCAFGTRIFSRFFRPLSLPALRLTCRGHTRRVHIAGLL